MTGEELAATLLRHGVEVVGCEWLTTRLSQPTFSIRARDSGISGDLEALLPYNVEMAVQLQDIAVARGIDVRPLGFSRETRQVCVRGRNPDALTSPPPTTTQRFGGAVMPGCPVPRSQRPPTPTPRARATEPAQVQDFRADLWRRMCQNLWTGEPDDDPRYQFRLITRYESGAFYFGTNSLSLTGDRRLGFTDDDILHRWSVYQALKPLYDVVDGVEGATSAAMPRDVEEEWNSRSGGGSLEEDYILFQRDGRFIAQNSVASIGETDSRYGSTLQQFPSILDAVAFARVAAAETTPAPPQPSATYEFRAGLPSYALVAAHERSGGMWQSSRTWQRRAGSSRPYPHATDRWHFVTNFGRVYQEHSDGGATICNPNLDEWASQEFRPLASDGSCIGWDVLETAAQTVPTPQQPIRGRRADLLTIDDITEPTSAILTLDDLTSTLPTFFPGDEPRVTGIKRASGRDGVFTVSVQLGKTGGRTTSATAIEAALPSNLVLDVTTHAGTKREFRGTGSAVFTAPTQRRRPAAPTTPPAPTRWNQLDLDDGPVAKPTTATSTLKRGSKPPTVAQIRKFRDAFEGRSGIGAAECAKAANFGDDEVAQHLLVSWCGGLSDDEAVTMLREAGSVRDLTQPSVDTWASRYRRQLVAALDTDPAADPSAVVATWQQEQQRRRRRAAELRSKTVRRVIETAVELPNRWDLLELDGAVLPPTEELRVKPTPRHTVRTPVAKPWQPPTVPPKHIDLRLPEPTVDYVDVSMLPAELHPSCVVACLLDEAGKVMGSAGKVN